MILENAMKLKKILISLLLSIGLIGTTCLSYADFNDGWTAYEKEDYKTAFKEWSPLAEEGNAISQTNLQPRSSRSCLACRARLRC